MTTEAGKELGRILRLYDNYLKGNTIVRFIPTGELVEVVKFSEEPPDWFSYVSLRKDNGDRLLVALLSLKEISPLEALGGVA